MPNQFVWPTVEPILIGVPDHSWSRYGLDDPRLTQRVYLNNTDMSDIDAAFRCVDARRVRNLISDVPMIEFLKGESSQALDVRRREVGCGRRYVGDEAIPVSDPLTFVFLRIGVRAREIGHINVALFWPKQVA